MRVNRVRGVLVGALAARRRRPLREWVESTWIALGGPACVRERTELENAESFFELLEGIEADGASAEELSGLANGIFAKTETGSDIRVKVMTIHKAKGLEFDTVIVPGLGRGAQKDDARLLLWREGAAESGAELLLAPISQKGAEETDPIYRYLQKAEAERASEEEKRLLYVAVTRAKRNLYLVAQPVLTQKGELRQNRSLLRFLWPGLREDFRASETAKVEQPLALAASEESERGPRMLHRLTADWQLPAGPESLSWRAEETTGAVHDGLGITYDWVGEKLRHIGTVVHSMTQCIARDGLKCWPVGRIAQSRPIFRAALAERGLGANDLDEAVAQVEQALLTLITDERGQWILSPHADAQNEFSLSGVLDSGRVEHVVLDRTFIDEDGTRWIIDYKTARHEGSGLEAFLDNEQLRHKEQLERYAMLVRRLDPGRPIRFGLYFPLLSGWREWSDVG